MNKLIDAVLSEAIMHLVVNGHLMGAAEKAELEREVLAKLPEIYELARTAEATKSQQHYAFEIDRSDAGLPAFNHNLVR